MKKANFKEIGNLYYKNKSETIFLLDEILTQEIYNEFEIQEGDTVFDIGANIGIYSILAAKKCGPSGRVFAFEPVPELNSILSGNVQLHGLEKTVTVKKVGISDAKGEKTFDYYPYLTALSSYDSDQNKRIETISKNRTECLSLMETAMPRTFKVLKYLPFLEPVILWGMKKLMTSKKTITCQFERLDDSVEEEIIETIDFMKIDAEGAEWDILSSISDSLWLKIKKMVIEVHVGKHDEQIESLLLAKQLKVSKKSTTEGFSHILFATK